jgi:uncharacterized protein
MNSEDKSEPAKSLTRIIVRPIGSPLPLGFFAFAVGTTLLACVELKWLPPSEMHAVVFILLGYVAPLELLPCIFAFLARDTGTATTMGIFGSGWVALSLYYLFFGIEAHTATVGVFLVMDSLAIFALCIASFEGKPMLALVLLFSSIRFVLAAALQFGAGPNVAIAAGAFGLLTGALAVYGGLALLLEDVKQKTVLPVFRRKAARQSIEGNLQDQLQRLETEAGVRRQL